MPMNKLNISDTLNKELPADKDTSNARRQVVDACYSYVSPRIPSEPKLVHFSSEMLHEIGLCNGDAAGKEFLDLVSGKKIYPDTNPYSMCYGGHQFGNWAGQLGDGRAINLFEVEHDKKRWALQLKGAGETPYSRTADGLAVLRSSVREHLCSEAMYHLGVPTTRSLSLCTTGDEVMRDVMYDGNPALEKGAVVCRVAPSFLRFGNFQLFASRKDVKTLRQLTDYTIKYFFEGITPGTKEGYVAFFNEVLDRSLNMVIEWQRVGFVHGVMNTDNMSILGLTIDYGPYGWLEGYDKNWTPNTTDRNGRRYRFGNQPSIVLWNLYQLANALMLLVEDAQPLEAAIARFKSEYPVAHVNMMKSKLGLVNEDDGDVALVASLEELLGRTETDMTIFFRKLSDVTYGVTPLATLTLLEDAFYKQEEIEGDIKADWLSWLQKYQQRLEGEARPPESKKEAMNKVNPKYVLRNYMAQLAIDAADNGDYGLVDEMYNLLGAPYDEQPAHEKWFAKRPEWARHKVGCSMLSCSS